MTSLPGFLLCGARENVVERIHGLTVPAHLVVDVWGRAASRAAHLRDDIVPFHPLPHVGEQPGGVGIAGDITVTVVDLDHVAVSLHAPREGHDAGSGGHDRGRVEGVNIDALMGQVDHVNGVPSTPAEQRRDDTADRGDRGDRREEFDVRLERGVGLVDALVKQVDLALQRRQVIADRVCRLRSLRVESPEFVLAGRFQSGTTDADLEHLVVKADPAGQHPRIAILLRQVRDGVFESGQAIVEAREFRFQQPVFPGQMGSARTGTRIVRQEGRGTEETDPEHAKNQPDAAYGLEGQRILPPLVVVALEQEDGPSLLHHVADRIQTRKHMVK